MDNFQLEVGFGSFFSETTSASGCGELYCLPLKGSCDMLFMLLSAIHANREVMESHNWMISEACNTIGSSLYPVEKR